MIPAATQAFRRTLLLAGTVLAAACGGRSSIIPPASPEAAVRGFMNALKANSLSAMGEVWGSQRGPATTYMNREELDQRLTIIRRILDHERFEILESQGGTTSGQDGRRTVQVRLTRRGCTPVVPFTVLPYGGGWLISDIDLSAAGNPQRSCPAGSGASGTSAAGSALAIR